MRSQWVSDDVMGHILAALMPANRLAVIVSLTTGLRISDVLNMRTCKLAERMSIVELKTGKRRTVRLSAGLVDELLAIAGKIYVFEGRCDPRKHRTRQAVYKDIKRAARAYRVAANLTPHSCRKMYAVKQYKRTCSLSRVRELLNHSDEAVTMIYALADALTAGN